MRSFRVFTTALAVVALWSCGSSGGTEPPPPPQGGGPGPVSGGNATASVTVRNNSYSPGQVSIAPGGTVTWQWDACSGDGYGGQICGSHSVTFDDGGPSAGVRTDGSFARTFSSVGNYTYYCTSHGRSAMSGSVTVQ
jgi:plastocyanin